MPIIVAAAQSSSLRLYAGLWPGLDDIASASERKKNFLTANLPLILSLHRPKCRFVAAFRLGKSLSRWRARSGSQREPRTRIPTLIVYVVGSEIELDRGLTRALHHLDHCHRESVSRAHSITSASTRTRCSRSLKTKFILAELGHGPIRPWEMSALCQKPTPFLAAPNPRRST